MTIGILLSTYNGSRWLHDQIESLINQTGVDICLFVRDDGSSDNTIEILEEYRGKFQNLIIFKENNVGATLSFYKLAQLVVNSNVRCDYYAFCDQDDIWESDKLITAVNWLETQDNDRPNLYFSNLMMVKQDGRSQIGKLINAKAISTCKSNGLAAIGTYGCTCVFNEAGLKHFCAISVNRQFIFHDNWMYAVCAFCGNIYYDDIPHIFYRQTGSNASGEKKTGISLWIGRIKKAFNLNDSRRIYENIAIELLEDFQNEISYTDQKYLKMFTNYRGNITSYFALIFSRRTKTKSFSKNLCIIGRTVLKAL